MIEKLLCFDEHFGLLIKYNGFIKKLHESAFLFLTDFFPTSPFYFHPQIFEHDEICSCREMNVSHHMCMFCNIETSINRRHQS